MDQAGRLSRDRFEAGAALAVGWAAATRDGARLVGVGVGVEPAAVRLVRVGLEPYLQGRDTR